MIVLPDADVDAAADAAVSAGYGSAGERCMAVSVVVAVGDVAEPLVDAIRERIPKVRVGDGMDPSSEMGPLVTREHRDKVASYVENAPGEGATVVVDGREGVPAEGFFLNPSLLDDVTPEMKAYVDEIFGPVLGVTRVATYEEAVRLVNESPYGNGVAIFTRDGGAARQFQFDVQAGMVGINVPIPVPVAYYSFGGWKSSLFGDRHVYGPEAIDFYTRGKVVTSRWPDPGHVEDRPRLPADALRWRSSTRFPRTTRRRRAEIYDDARAVRLPAEPRAGLLAAARGLHGWLQLERRGQGHLRRAALRARHARGGPAAALVSYCSLAARQGAGASSSTTFEEVPGAAGGLDDADRGDHGASRSRSSTDATVDHAGGRRRAARARPQRRRDRRRRARRGDPLLLHRRRSTRSACSPMRSYAELRPGVPRGAHGRPADRDRVSRTTGRSTPG